ncbi:MAG: homoserine dehydrogenase, partial [Hyphomicrobiales bacterium]|nr:homoserine dehydrogenase [Hyphomicrobiales bacterium]
GIVGAAFVDALARGGNALAARAGRPLKLAAVSARTRDKGRKLAPDAKWYDDAVALARAPDVDVFVELIGGAEGVARACVEAALESGKHVVTANKALLAAHGPSLAVTAEARGVALAYEAAVAGGIPIVKTLRESLAGGSPKRVFGVLNGTCNYILSKMETEGLDFADCLADAQRLGYAEADPSFDVGGHDTAHKLAILASIAFGTLVDAEGVHVEGIERITRADIRAADELGYRIKLLGVAAMTPDGLEQRVHPTMTPKSSPIAQAMGVLNAVTIDSEPIGEVTLTGPGAGGPATAASVVSDVVDLARGRFAPTFGAPVASLRAPDRAPIQRHEGGYYVRLAVSDRPGAMAAIATRMAERNISLESIMQRGRAAAGGVVPVVLITHATSEAAIRGALDRVVEDGYLEGRPQVIRIERE